MLTNIYHVNAEDHLKNLYILIEPTPIENSEKDLLLPSFKNLEIIAKWLSKKRSLYSKVYITSPGLRKGKEYKGKQIQKIAKKHIFPHLYKLIKNKREYSMPKALGTYTSDIQRLGWKGSETLLLIFGDINFVKNGFDSHGKYLNSAWLSNKDSPYVRYFLQKDNSISKNSSVIVITRTQIDLKHEKMRKDFLVNLFSHEKVGMKVYYIGELHNKFFASLKDHDTLCIKILDQVRRKMRKPIDPIALPKTEKCQMVSKNGAFFVNNCGR